MKTPTNHAASAVKPPASPPANPPVGIAPKPAEFDPNMTMAYQAKMNNKAPVWFASMLAGTHREKLRVRDELGRLKGALPLLMKQRNGGKWTPDEIRQLRDMIRSASNVSPYLFVWAVPGSMLILPFLAWHLDTRRKRRNRQMPPGKSGPDKPAAESPAPDIVI